MENFTPLSGAVGGALIGLAAVIFAATTGRIAGISGIVGNALGARVGDLGWRIAFLAGLVAAPLLIGLVSGAWPVVELQASLPVLVVAGFIVGLGTRIGNGCTSGHGVCGIGLGSPRSIVATAVFFSAAVLTVFVVRHLLS
ncbi:MAG: hypothetical protein RLZ98_836 [Pseudomonadota bacterium]|jgi:uncharacterized membrane protein YedE/YeeE